MADPKVQINISALDNASKTIQTVAQAFDSLHSATTKIGSALAAIGVGISVHSLMELAKKSIEVSESIYKASQKIGITTESLSALRYTAQLAEVDFDSLVSGMAKFNKNIVEGAAGSAKQAEAFKLLGVSSEELKSNSPDELLSKVATQFKGMQDGAGKTAIAMALFGKAGANLIPLLNMGADGIQRAREEAEKFGLVLSTKTAKEAEEFNDNLLRLKGGFQGIVNQIMARNLPMMEKLSTAMIDHAKDADAVKRSSDTIATGLKVVASGGAVVVGVFETVGSSLGAFFAAMIFAEQGEFKKAWNVILDSAHDSAKEVKATADKIKTIWDDTTKKPEEKHSEGGKKRAAPFMGAGDPLSSDKTAADSKYLAYVTAFWEREAALTTHGNALSLEINRQSYEWGLTDLQTYLDTKNRLTESSLQAEINAKEKEYFAAGEAAEKAEKAVIYKKQGKTKVRDTDAESAAISEAWAKREKAEKAYNDAVAKQKEEKQKAADSDKVITTDTIRGYQEQQAAMLDMQGFYVEAAALRKRLDEESRGRLKLEADAMTGNIDAINAYWAAQEKGALDAAAAVKKIIDDRQTLFDIQSATKDIVRSTVGYRQKEDPYQKLDDQYGKDSNAVDAKIEEYDALSEADDKYIDQYNAFIDKKKAIDQNYVQDKKNLDALYQEEALTSLSNSLASIGQTMMKGNKDQFEAGKAMAIAGATISMTLGAIQAYTSMTSIPYVGPALGAIAAAAVVAAGLSNIATIESTQYQGRVLGGPVNAGQSYIVGERRPELFTPGVSGAITPYVPQGGSNLSVTHVWQISTGVSDTVRSELSRMLPMIDARSVAAVRNAQRQGMMQ